MNVRKLSLTSVCALTLAGMMAMWGGAATSSATGTKSKIVIGVDDDLTGLIAPYAAQTLTTLRAVVAYTNAHGGVDGHQVEVVTADEAAAGADASSAAEQLINENHVSMIFGLTLSNDCAAIASLATEHKVPIICTSVDPNDIKPVHPYVFGAAVQEIQEAPTTASFIENTLKIPKGAKVASITYGATGSEDYATYTDRALTKAGYDVVTEQIVPASASNASTQISAVVGSDPAVVVGEISPFEVQPLMTALQGAGNKAPMIDSNANVTLSAFTSIADPKLYGINVAKILTNLHSQPLGAQLAIAAYKLVGVTGVSKINQSTGLQEFPAAWASLQALKTCDACSGAKLVKALENVSVSLPGIVAGTFGWTASQHLGYKGMYLYGYNATTKLPQTVGPVINLGSV